MRPIQICWDSSMPNFVGIDPWKFGQKQFTIHIFNKSQFTNSKFTNSKFTFEKFTISSNSYFFILKKIRLKRWLMVVWYGQLTRAHGFQQKEKNYMCINMQYRSVFTNTTWRNHVSSYLVLPPPLSSWEISHLVSFVNLVICWNRQLFHFSKL